MVVDTSALLAVLLGAPESDAFIALLSDAADPLISAATLVEASIVRAGDDTEPAIALQGLGLREDGRRAGGLRGSRGARR